MVPLTHSTHPLLRDIHQAISSLQFFRAHHKLWEAKYAAECLAGRNMDMDVPASSTLQSELALLFQYKSMGCRYFCSC